MSNDVQGPGNRGPLLKLRFYRVNIFKMGKISFFVLVPLPLGNNLSQTLDDVSVNVLFFSNEMSTNTFAI